MKHSNTEETPEDRAKKAVRLIDFWLSKDGPSPLLTELARTRLTACMAWFAAGVLTGACLLLFAFVILVLA